MLCCCGSSLSDPVIVAAGVTLGETLRGLAHMKLSSEIIHLSTAEYIDTVRKSCTESQDCLGLQCLEVNTKF